MVVVFTVLVEIELLIGVHLLCLFQPFRNGVNSHSKLNAFVAQPYSRIAGKATVPCVR